MFRSLLPAAALTAALAAAEPALAIVGGTPAAPGDSPGVVALVQAGAPARSGLFCGGTLVAPDRVLTAAHCVAGLSGNDIDVVGGRLRLSQEGVGTRVGVVGFGRSPDGADAALLRLQRPLAEPVQAVAGPADGEVQAPGARGLVAGWGVTQPDGSGDVSDVLLRGDVTVRSDQACGQAYGRLPTDVFCAGGGRPDHCNGDSGGPLLVTGAGRRPVLAGIVSFGGQTCADPRAPGAYVAVRPLAAWLAGEGVPVEGGATAVGPPDVAPQGATSPVTVSFASVTCPSARCRVTLRVAGSQEPARIRLRVRRAAGRGRPAVDRVVSARRVAPGRWVAGVALPVGRLRLSAQPDGGRTVSTTLEVS